jgi:hypothetical protein
LPRRKTPLDDTAPVPTRILRDPTRAGKTVRRDVGPDSTRQSRIHASGLSSVTDPKIRTSEAVTKIRRSEKKRRAIGPAPSAIGPAPEKTVR